MSPVGMTGFPPFNPPGDTGINQKKEDAEQEDNKGNIVDSF